jgi:predicted RNase H-like nuclease (RuvC/YqgF family)
MSNENVQVNMEYVVESLSRQLAEQAQKIAMLESYLRQIQQPKQESEGSSVVDL